MDETSWYSIVTLIRYSLLLEATWELFLEVPSNNFLFCCNYTQPNPTLPCCVNRLLWISPGISITCCNLPALFLQYMRCAIGTWSFMPKLATSAKSFALCKPPFAIPERQTMHVQFEVTVKITWKENDRSSCHIFNKIWSLRIWNLRTCIRDPLRWALV